jgi:hypothetical protein
MFSLDSLALKDTTELQLRHPVTEELLWADKEQTKPVAISLYGTSSKQYRNAITAMQNRQLRRGKQKVSAETLREESISLLVSCSDAGINMDYNGAALDNEDAFRALYSDPKLSWVKDQVDAALGDPANFLAQ